MIRLILLLLMIVPYSVFAEEDWITPAEKSGYRTTPNYAETMGYIERVRKAAPDRVKVEPFGATGQGRTLYTVIVSADGLFDPIAIRKAGRAIVLIQNGIHAGEMDGKDASLALLRDMVITKKLATLLENLTILIIPVYNADGHERISRFNRINQNGPEEMGWRTTATNLNLNRDYMKADAPETRAFLKLWNRWLPDFFFDNHVTDGADYQYDVTYGVDHGPDVNPELARWLEQSLFPHVENSVRKSGHKISPFIMLADENDPSKGLLTGQSPPRFSTGYAILQNRPAMLVEMHMLKDYKTRVTGNYELMRATLQVLNRDAARLVLLNRQSDEATIQAGKNSGSVALKLDPTGETRPFQYEGIRFRITDSDVSGSKRIEYTGEPVTMTIPMQTSLKVDRAVKMPAAYIISPEWTRLIEVLEAHAVQLQRTTKPFHAEVDLYRCPSPNWEANPFEGRHPASFGERMQDVGFHKQGPSKTNCLLETRTIQYPVNSVVVPMAQRAAKVAVHFLEPEAPDSAVVWGFVDAIFEQKEYGESYVLEKLAREMMNTDAGLKKEFEQKIASDPAFAADPAARLNFFYRRSSYWDDRIGLYPVARLKSLAGVPIQ